MRRRLWLAACALFLAQCAIHRPGPEAFAFAAWGDTPYGPGEESAFLETIERMNAERVEFVVHIGDFKAGSHSPCTDALFLTRRAQFERSGHPFVYTPGDNDWTDCRRPTNGSGDAIERLERLRAIFFADRFSLGARRIATAVQDECLERSGGACRCGPFPENRLWEHGSVVFATINVQGSNNNRGFDAANDREADCRDRANLAWLGHAERRAEAGHGLVVFTQANLWDENPGVYKPYREALVAIADRLRKPVLFVHGDTHTYRMDTPFHDSTGAPLMNPTRLEVYGSPFVGWVKVRVDPSRPDLFEFDPHLVAVVPR